jgi:2-polyprenyl-3-methyl-5-hydroxy-6-metoxy-1,4-benzoquinol methylase
MTQNYYDQNADTFFAETVSLDMSALYERFLPHVPAGGHILDAGCGSGRDAKTFRDDGYRVTAFDASRALAERASVLLGQTVAVRSFTDVHEVAVYDGIWACASLLHVPEADITRNLQCLWTALKPACVLYCSVKIGAGERQHNGRHFTDADEPRMALWLRSLPDVDHHECWRTADQRPEREDAWLNVMVWKKL